MKILYVAWTFPAPSETFVLNQITGLIERGHDVSVLAISGQASGALQEEVTRYGLVERTKYLVPPPLGARERLRAGAGLVLRSLLEGTGTWRALNPRFRRMALSLQLLFAASGIREPLHADVIHCHFGGVGSIVCALRELGLVHGPILTTFHGHDIRRGLHVGPSAYALLAAQAEAVVAISPGNRRALASFGFPPERIVDHAVGIDTHAIAAACQVPRPSQTPLRLLTVARMVPEKSLATLLQALALLRRDQPELAFHWRLIGGGPLEHQLRRLATELDLLGHVTLEGSQPQSYIREALAAADLFVLSSVAEVLPLSLMEAHAAGLPIVATRVGDIDSIVREGVSGLLVPKSDAPAMASALARLLGDAELRASYGRAGQAHVLERFDIHILNDRLEQLLSRLARESVQV
jgi:colanic acid/amylovoran biosynthesis glycosyltransferase